MSEWESRPWQSVFTTKAGALRYLDRIRDPTERARTAVKLGLGEEPTPRPAHPATGLPAPSTGSLRNSFSDGANPLPRITHPHAILPRAPRHVPAQALHPDALTAFLTSPPGILTLDLPYPPTVNTYWRSMVVRCKPSKPGAPPYRAAVFVSREGRVYREAVKGRVTALRTHGPVEAPPGARLGVRVVIYPPDKRARDLDNIFKALLDSLTHARVYADDSLIDDLNVSREAPHPGGRVVVTIRPLTATLFGAGT